MGVVDASAGRSIERGWRPDITPLMHLPHSLHSHHFTRLLLRFVLLQVVTTAVDAGCSTLASQAEGRGFEPRLPLHSAYLSVGVVKPQQKGSLSGCDCYGEDLLPTPIPAGALTVSLTDALSQLTNAYTVSGRSPRTTQLHTHYVSRLAEFVVSDGTTDVEQVTTDQITAFLAAEQERGLKPASLSVVLRTLRRFFQFCVERKIIEANPAKAVLAPTVTIEPVRFMTDEQVDALLRSIGRKSIEDVRDAAMFRVLASGMRRGELIGLRVEDVDCELKTLTIRATTSKTRKGRTVGMSSDAARYLTTYLKVRAAFIARTKRVDDGALWISAKGPLKANGALAALRRRLKAAGLPPATLHSFRHKMAATATQHGVPMAYLMNAGGWSSPAMPTMRYGTFAVEPKAIAVLQALLDR